jgi:PAT family beta-lactamase induction signal transducer AmpG
MEKSPEKPRPSFREIVTDRRLALMLALGFSSGLPFLLIFSTQSALLREAGVSRSDIGLMSYVALAFTFKFLWAPVIDTCNLPVLTGLLGRRRSWMMLAQIGVAIGLCGIAFGDPAHFLGWTVACSFFTALAAATQDIVIDGWRIDSAPPDQQGMLAATYQLGYRLSLLCAGAGALYIADFVSWKAAYLAMSVLTLVGMIACLLSPRVADKVAVGKAGFSLASSFYEPLADLTKRFGWRLAVILALVAIYRLPDFVSGVMANPLYIDLGFSKSDIATVSKVYGVWIGLAGIFAGGFSVARLGMMPTLMIGGIAASASHLTMAYLAASGARLDLLTAAISVENFAGGFAGTALIAYMSSLTSPLFAATQYALLSSLYALPGKFIGGLSGFMVDAFGYTKFFASTSLIGLPVAVLCAWVWWLNRKTTTPVSENSVSET